VLRQGELVSDRSLVGLDAEAVTTSLMAAMYPEG
jgi:hypothetical protein